MNDHDRPVADTRDPWRGIAGVLAAAALWGTTGTAQALAGGSLPPLWFGALRLLAASAFFAAFAAAAGGLRADARRAVRPAELLAAGLCMAAYNLAFFAGVRATGVAIGTAIALGSGPIWAGLLQALLQRQPPRPAWWASTAVAIAGGVLLSGVATGDRTALSWAGVAGCLLAGLAYAVYTLVNQRVAHRAPASTFTLGAFGIASLIALPVAAVGSGLPAFAPRDLIAAAFTGFVSTGIAYLLYARALRHLSGATGVTLALAEPVVAFVLAATLLREPTGGAAWGGLVLVVAGVLGVVRTELAYTGAHRGGRRVSPSRVGSGS